eukprot:SAG31_NODE_610_length_13564_cov_3.189528_12_plen_89_part_00
MIAAESQRFACLGFKVPVAPELNPVSTHVVDYIVVHVGLAAESQLNASPQPIKLVPSEFEAHSMIRENASPRMVLIKWCDAGETAVHH